MVAFRHLVHSLNPNEGGVSSSVFSLNHALNELGVSSGLYDKPKSIDARKCTTKTLNVVHGLWHWPSRLALKKKNKDKTPYIIFPHGMLDPWFKKTYPFKHFKKQIYWFLKEGIAIRNANFLCFTTHEEMSLARHTFMPYKCEERVVGLGVDNPPAKNLSIRQTLCAKFPELMSKKVLLYLGRFHKKKGIDLLLNTWIQRRPKDSVLVLAGPIEEGSSYIKRLQSQSLKCDKTILWTGMLDENEKWEMMRLSEALILPSHQENFGMVVAESLAVGKPVYITNKVNLWREVEQSNAGLVRNDDQEGINQLVDHWLNQSYFEISKCAEPCFLQNFHIRKAAENLINLAENLDS